MKYTTLLVPLTLVLMMIIDFGNTIPSGIVDTQLLMTAGIMSFGLWLLGFITGRL